MYSGFDSDGGGVGLLSKTVDGAFKPSVCVPADCICGDGATSEPFWGCEWSVPGIEPCLLSFRPGDPVLSRCRSMRLDTSESISDLRSSADLPGDGAYIYC